MVCYWMVCYACTSRREQAATTTSCLAMVYIYTPGVVEMSMISVVSLEVSGCMGSSFHLDGPPSSGESARKRHSTKLREEQRTASEE